MNDKIKLPGRRNSAFSIFGQSETLMLCEDHLLHVESDGYTERYRRFNYADIESIVTAPSKRRKRINVMLVVVFLVIFIISYAIALSMNIPPDRVYDRMFTMFFCLAIVFILPVTINEFRGPTCKTVLRTRVTTVTLTSLRRVESTEKALAMLEEKISAV